LAQGLENFVVVSNMRSSMC